MDHSEAKLMLARALDSADRKAAVSQAIQLGMSLTEVEEYLDWVDASRAQLPAKAGFGHSLAAAVARLFRRPGSEKRAVHPGKSAAIPQQ